MKGNAGLKPTKRKIVDSHPNQWTGNPKQILMLAYYLDTKARDTFGNAYQSAIKAGYSESYARQITSPAVKNMWLQEYQRMLTKLEPEHITQGIQDIAVNGIRDSDRLRAYELLAKIQGLLIDRTATVNFNIETALSELK